MLFYFFPLWDSGYDNFVCIGLGLFLTFAYFGVEIIHWRHGELPKSYQNFFFGVIIWHMILIPLLGLYFAPFLIVDFVVAISNPKEWRILKK